LDKLTSVVEFGHSIARLDHASQPRVVANIDWRVGHGSRLRWLQAESTHGVSFGSLDAVMGIDEAL
jgi:hypothetical protein